METTKQDAIDYRRIVNLSQDIVCACGTDGNLKDLNHACENILGYTREELLSEPFINLIYPDDKVRTYKEMEGLASGFPTTNFENRLIHKDGSIRYISWKAQPAANRKIFYAVGRDITDRKQAKEEKEVLKGQLRQTQKMEAIGILAGGIAHDFNNILSIIFGYTDLAIMDVENIDRLKRDLKQVRQGAARAKELISQIMALSRETEQERQPIKIFLILKETLKLLRSSFPATIEIRQDIESQKKVLIDSTQIHQIIINLCTNAYQAMRETGGVLSVSLKDIEISEDSIIPGLKIPPGNYLSLKIEDTGHGMDKEQKERIFEPYFTTREIGEGTGLGLSVVREIVKRHKGYISVYSKPGVGTTFQVHLPVFEASSAEGITSDSKEPVMGGDESILFVDDEERIVDIAREVLNKFGYKTNTFLNGIQAFREFEKRPDQYDLVIADMTMPRMNGIEFAEKIFKLRPHIPVILCTGHSDLINKEKAGAIGIYYFQKPIDMSELMRVVRKKLDEAHL